MLVNEGAVIMEAKEEKMYKTLDLIQINLNNILISDKISTNSNLYGNV